MLTRNYGMSINGTFFEMDFPTLAESAKKRPKEKQETLAQTLSMKITLDPYTQILTFTDPKTAKTVAELFKFAEKEASS